ncbi:hypothetical protein lerEdw1_018017, partial [Lerista edwardsae]
QKICTVVEPPVLGSWEDFKPSLSTHVGAIAGGLCAQHFRFHKMHHSSLSQITAAGGHLKFTISYDLTGEEDTAEAIFQPDVIIEGNGLRISTSHEGIHLTPFEEHTEEVLLKHDLFMLHGTDSPVSKREFMTVLANIKRLLIRATYSNGMNAIYRLSDVSLEVADRFSAGGKYASAVEVCQCPPGYSGTSCEVSILILYMKYLIYP